MWKLLFTQFIIQLLQICLQNSLSESIWISKHFKKLPLAWVSLSIVCMLKNKHTVLCMCVCVRIGDLFVTHLTCHDEHVNHARRSVAPVHQSVGLIAEGWWVVARAELFVPYIIYTWPDQLSQNFRINLSRGLERHTEREGGGGWPMIQLPMRNGLER